jgi:hypothetical protein
LGMRRIASNSGGMVNSWGAACGPPIVDVESDVVDVESDFSGVVALNQLRYTETFNFYEV